MRKNRKAKYLYCSKPVFEYTVYIYIAYSMSPEKLIVNMVFYTFNYFDYFKPKFIFI